MDIIETTGEARMGSEDQMVEHWQSQSPDFDGSPGAIQENVPVLQNFIPKYSGVRYYSSNLLNLLLNGSGEKVLCAIFTTLL